MLLAVALAQGVPPERIVVDPGHDLNKNTYHSLELTRRLPEITGLGYPTLVAVSNKDFIGETLDTGVDVVNDVTALRGDPRSAPLVAESGVAVVLISYGAA